MPAYPDQRLQTPDAQDVLKPEKLQTVATPVDTFHQTAAGQQLAQLAGALQNIAPHMAQYAGELQDNKNRKDYQAGLNKATEIGSQAKTYKQAIDEGLIDQTGSPYFQMGVRENYGKITASQRDDAIRAAMKADPALQDATDLKQFDDAYQKAGKAWDAANLPANQQDQYFKTGFNGRSQALMSNARSQFVDVIGANLKSQSLVSVYQDTKNHIRDVIDKLPPEQVMEQLHMMLDGYDSIGMDSRMVEKSALHALGDLAMETPGGNPKIAALLPLLKSAQGGLVIDARGGVNAEYAREVTLGTARQRAEDERRQHETIQYDREKRTRDAAGQAMQRLLSNPAADTRDLEKSVSDMPEAVAQIAQARRIATSTDQYDDDDIEADLFNKIWKGQVNEQDILQAYNQHGGRGLSLQTATRLVGEVRQRLSLDRSEERAARMEGLAQRQEAAAARREAADARREYRDTVGDPLLTNTRSQLKSQFAGEGTGILAGASATYAARAEGELTKAWAVWQSTPEGQNASPVQRVEWLQKNSDALVAHYRPMTAGGKVVQGMVDKASGKTTAKVDQRMPKTYVLKPEDLQAYIQKSPPTAHVRQVMQASGLTPADFGDFIEAQIKLKPK